MFSNITHKNNFINVKIQVFNLENLLHKNFCPQGNVFLFYRNNYAGIDGLVELPQHMLKDTGNIEVVPFLMNVNVSHPEIITTVPPRDIYTNCNFIVDLDELLHPEDVLSDGLGAWKQTDTCKKPYTTKNSNGVVISVTACKKGSEDVCAVRRTYRNVSDNTLRRVIVQLESETFNHRVVFISYIFAGDSHRINVLPHGNSKCAASYVRTFKSTKCKLNVEIDKTKSLRRSIFNVTNDVGGLSSASCPSSIPKDTNQLKYMRMKRKEAKDDPIFNITQAMKNGENEGKEKFIRSYTLDDGSPKVIAFLDRQLEDIANFCCNDVVNFKSLLYVDVTFQLGPFFLLVTAYRNTTLFMKGTDVSPSMIGPVMMCMLKEGTTYLTLFQKLTAQLPGLKLHLQGYASDSEQALRNALAQEFSNAVSFLCGIHAKRNLSDKCQNLGLSKELTSTIIKDIFGAGGLVYCQDRLSFDTMCTHLQKKWDDLEKNEKHVPSFSKYFMKYKMNDIYDHVRVPLSVECGFGDKLISTNPIEAINSVIKRWNNFQAADMASFLDDIKDCINEQFTSVQRAYFNLPSPYTVRQEYAKYTITDYFSLGHEQRQSAANKITSISIDSKRQKEVTQHKVFPAVIETYQMNEANETNGPDDEISNENDPFNILVTIFARPDIDNLSRKARSIVENQQIIKAFSDTQYFVKGSTVRTVAIHAKGINCDKDCLGFARRKICSHTIALAIYTDNLSNYLTSFVKSFDHNLTRLTVASVNSNAGKKCAPRKRARAKSPDVVKVTPPTSPSFNITLGDLLSSNTEKAVQQLSNSGMKMKIVNKPKKPTYVETTSTEFELIPITGKISKCAGCGSNLKDATEFLADQYYCIRHKEKDHIYIISYNYWKPTFSNKHYHLAKQCILARNESFKSESVVITVDVDDNLKKCLSSRFK